MTITIRIDDDLLRQLKERARAENVSLTEIANRILRDGLSGEPVKRTAYREKVCSLGQPLVNLDKALALAAAMEDEETIRKMSLGK